MFKKLQKLLIATIALALIYILSTEMLAMASGWGPQTCGGIMQYGGVEVHDISIDNELALPWWQVKDDPRAIHPYTGIPGYLWDDYVLAGNNGILTLPTEKCPPGKIDYFKWWKKELQCLSKGNFNEYCDYAWMACLKKFAIKENLRTPIYFYDDSFNKFKAMYDKLKLVLEFNEEPNFEDEKYFFAENLYFMACKLCQCKSNYSASEWEKIELAYSNFFKEIFSLIPLECLRPEKML